MDFLSNTSNIRNICILAHVDHGKTTISDSLIASNKIISHRMAGKMRYLDNTRDEQERGITMKSSSISLKYNDESGGQYLINLVDTPGHVDFCGEVSAAIRLCDGALIVVDVVEGVCPQTKAALEQAWKEGIEPILILNKIDRLILEQQLDGTAAHLRLNQLLEQVNAIVATLLTTEIFEDEASAELEKTRRNHSKSRNLKDDESPTDTNIDSSIQVYDWASAIEDLNDDKYYFMPEKNNVVFSSSIDGWAFTIETLATILSTLHKINLTALRKTLWGDFYIDTKQKRILKNAQAKTKKTLFTSMVLDNIWEIYNTVCIRRDKVRMEKMCQKLGIELSQRDMNHSDSRHQVKLIMSSWLQLAKTVLGVVAKLVPSPKDLSERRVERLLSSNLKRFGQLHPETQKLKSSFLRCSSDESAVKVACISKMLPYERRSLPENRKNIIRREPLTREATHKTGDDSEVKEVLQPLANESETIFIAFARVFSGKIQRGDKLYVLGPRHDPCKINLETLQGIDESRGLEDLDSNEHVTVVVVENFYLLMGRELERIDYALAGNIVGIQGLERHMIRTATLSNELYCPPFNDLHLPATPILRVAIEPKNLSDMNTLISGLKFLNQADPCVEVKLQQTGEHVIVATGEVHLEHCIKELKERYANDIELNISRPIVPFRETIVFPPKTDMVNETIDDNNIEFTHTKKQPNKKGIVELLTPNKKCRIKLRALPLPEELSKCLTDNNEQLKIMAKLVNLRQMQNPQLLDHLSNVSKKKIEDFKKELGRCASECRKFRTEYKLLFDESFTDRIWSFGPKYSGPNLLVASQNVDLDYSHWLRMNNQSCVNSLSQKDLSNYIDSFISGFQLATQSGPLCEEPMMGVCFTVLEWCYTDLNFTCINEKEHHKERPPGEIDESRDSVLYNMIVPRDNYGPMSGQIISTVKEGCRKAFQAQPQRLMSPMFSCDIQVTSEVLGKMYAVLAKRNGRIVHGDMREGSQTFEIKAFVPVIESLDFVNEIRKQTSGMANPQLMFSHYEILDVDPFWTPNTEEEYALFGEKADTENQALKYMNLVRRRKGLAVQEKIVEHGEKQRTNKRNK